MVIMLTLGRIEADVIVGMLLEGACDGAPVTVVGMLLEDVVGMLLEEVVGMLLEGAVTINAGASSNECWLTKSHTSSVVSTLVGVVPVSTKSIASANLYGKCPTLSKTYRWTFALHPSG
eukprot:CAMPEP_0195328178 /NCGR_PEP_ID=MMETSP0708-20121125/10680_1 /TAXON_ID=33640 /ORGANISM="Asterionellopsis glacialis, Strain CCMP134" /LENGTH=118 /DNA_ID=CAMNT_0040396001 /DNA_START=185 /DNA_END=541 /DNA_ORIENTATION=+